MLESEFISTWRTHCQPQNGLQLPGHKRTGRAETSANPQKPVTWVCTIKTAKTEHNQTTSCDPIHLPPPKNLFHFSVLHNTLSANKWMENIWKTHKGISTGMRHWSRRLLGRSVKIWRCITCVRNKGPQGCEYMVGVGIAFVLRVHFHVLFSFTVITWKSAGTTTSTKMCVCSQFYHSTFKEIIEV